MKESTQTLYIYNKLCDKYGITEHERWADINKVVPMLVDRLKFDGHAVSYDTDAEGNVSFINFPANFRIDW